MHAWLVFADEGYEQTSLRKIARNAGISSSLITYLFHSKEELWYAAVVAQMDPTHNEYMHEFDALLQQPQAGFMEIKQLLMLCIDRTLEDPVRFRFLFTESEGDGARSAYLRERYLMPYLQKVYVLYTKACAASQHTPMDSSTLFTVLMGVVRFILFPNLLGMFLPAGKNDSTQIRELMSRVLNQLLPE